MQTDAPDYLATIEASIAVPQKELTEFTVREVVLVESLLTPGLQTSVKVHSFLHSPVKDLDKFKNATISLKINRPILSEFGYPTDMTVNQRIYRLSNRKLINNNNEEFVLHACDDTLLNDARSLVSKSWKCSDPSSIVSEILSTCVGAINSRVESSSPARPYIAENIHPFQVIAQQADFALAGSNDPSFLHFMTYDNDGAGTGGIHNFRSLYTMTKQSPIITLNYSETGEARTDSAVGGYRNPRAIMTYNFPCDFDLLSDILNGVDVNGSSIMSLIAINPFSKMVSLLGDQALGCGIGSGPVKIAMTNQNTAQDQDSCPTVVEDYMLKRQARMNLLEQDKVALRLTVPWNPIFHVGSVIKVELYSKEFPDQMLYGSGEYLISVMQHTLKQGGYSTTTLDCVSTTTGSGVQ